jgi:phage terminase large subunit
MKEIKYTNVFTRNRAARTRTVVNIGGAGSSKSYSLAQLMIARGLKEKGKKFGITRKTFPALRRTAYDLIINLLKDYEVYGNCRHDRTNHLLTLPGESRFDFFSLDDAEKIKSADFNYIWMEEANEFSWDDYVTGALRSLRAPKAENDLNQIFLSLNPTDEYGWINEKLLQKDDVTVIHSTYRDNPFLDQDYIASLEALKTQDENYYRIYALGEWGRLENVIFRNYLPVDDWPPETQVWAYGLDFGFSNPTALVKVGVNEGIIYLQEILHRSHLTNAEVIEFLTHQPRADVYADSAEPQRIEEIRRAGVNIYPANKDVKFGLDLMKRRALKITRDSPNLLKEFISYQYKKDKDGRILEEPVKFNDHGIDAARYACAGVVARFGFATAVPIVRIGGKRF